MSDLLADIAPTFTMLNENFTIRQAFCSAMTTIVICLSSDLEQLSTMADLRRPNGLDIYYITHLKEGVLKRFLNKIVKRVSTSMDWEK